jgi:hypothetical protein
MVAALILAVNIAIDPIMERLAYMERGYDAIGGEVLLFIFGFVLAFAVLDHGWRKHSRAMAADEQKENDTTAAVTTANGN